MDYSKLMDWSPPLSGYAALSGGVNAFGRMGAEFGRLRMGAGSRRGSSATPTIISASIRTRVPQQSNNAFFGAQINTNPYTYTRIRDKAVRSVTGARAIYANVGVSTSTTIPASINSGRQEQGVGSSQTIRGMFLTGTLSTAVDSSSATATTMLWSDAANDLGFTVGSQTLSGCIWKLDNSVTPPTFTRKTYAQFQADGGSIGSSTVNSSTVNNTQVVVPTSYVIISDAMTSLTAGQAYYWCLEEKTPVITVTSITDGTGQFTVNTANTGLIQAGDVGTVASATGNTTVNGTWQVASVVANTSITFTAATATTGTVTGTPTLRFTHPIGVVNANIITNNLGDYIRASATQRDVMGTGNWTAVGTNITTDGQLASGYCAIIGTDATGGESVVTVGDSIAAEVRDGQTNSPAATLLGDSDGNLTWINRALFASNVPAIRTAVPGMKALTAYTANDDKFRLWLHTFADVEINLLGHNDATSVGSYSASPGFKQYLIASWDRGRAALRGTGVGRIVTATLTPLTAELLTDHWTTGRNSTYQQQGGTGGASTQFIYPTGYVYANFHPDLSGGTLVTSATGGVDGYIDLATYTSNLNGVAAIDGFWPVDGATNYKYVTDGTHPSKDGHAGIASQVTTSVLRTAKVIR